MMRSCNPLIRMAVMIQCCILCFIILTLTGAPANAGSPDDQQPPPPGAAAAMCWPPEALQASPSSPAIRRNIPAAFVAPPKGQLAPFAPVTPGKRGAIRRVELPPGSRKLIALTFDLCEQPHEIAGYDGAIAEFLRRRAVKATFFAGGKWLLTHKEAAQQLMADPLFEIGNHAWEHRNLRLLSGAALRNEIRYAQLAYESLRGNLAARQCLGRDGKTLGHARAGERMSLFRFPYGACNAASLDEAAASGLLSIQWDVASGDPWPGQSAELIVSAVLRNVRPGSIVIFHANGRGWHTAKALPLIVAKLEQQGYEFVTVSELLNTPGAKWDIRPVCFGNKPGDTDRYDAVARRLEEQYRKFARRFAPPSGPAAPLPGATQAGPR